MSLSINLVAGEPRRMWCEGCLTSAAWEADVLYLDDDGGPRPLGGRVMRGCVRCDGGEDE